MCPHAGILSVILANSTLHLDRIHRALEVESKKMKELGGQWVSLSLVGISAVTYNLSMGCVNLKMKIKLQSESSERTCLCWCSSYSRTTKFLMVLKTVGDKWKYVSNFCNTCFVCHFQKGCNWLAKTGTTQFVNGIVGDGLRIAHNSR